MEVVHVEYYSQRPRRNEDIQWECLDLYGLHLSCFRHCFLLLSSLLNSFFLFVWFVSLGFSCLSRRLTDWRPCCQLEFVTLERKILSTLASDCLRRRDFVLVELLYDSFHLFDLLLHGPIFSTVNTYFLIQVYRHIFLQAYHSIYIQYVFIDVLIYLFSICLFWPLSIPIIPSILFHFFGVARLLFSYCLLLRAKKIAFSRCFCLVETRRSLRRRLMVECG